jgi:hypothetical protein
MGGQETDKCIYVVSQKDSELNIFSEITIHASPFKYTMHRSYMCIV